MGKLYILKNFKYTRMINNKKKFLIIRKNLFLISENMGYYKLVLEKEQPNLKYLNLYKYQTFIKTKLLILYLKKCKVKKLYPAQDTAFSFIYRIVCVRAVFRMLINPDAQSRPEDSERFR